MADYFLMNKDDIVGRFAIRNNSIEEISIKQRPYGCNSLYTWLNGRKAFNHNNHIRNLMREFGCDTTEGFLRVTHATSVNDTFWVKGESENVSWNNVSLYSNQYNKTVSMLALLGYGIPSELAKTSTTIPEFTTNGSYGKCFERDAENIYLCKKCYTVVVNGKEIIPENAGYEPYCEVMASELANIICSDAVTYSLSSIQGIPVSKCRLFTDEKIGYAPFSSLEKEDALTYYKELGYENEYRRMIIFDSLVFNDDRHEGNFGIIFDNDTLKPVKMAPVFDFNRSLIPYFRKDPDKELSLSINTYLKNQIAPKTGRDFTSDAHSMMTDDIKRDVKDICNFEFSFRGNDYFPEERVIMLENMIHRQAEAIISEKQYCMNDVFPVPKTAAELARKQVEEFVDQIPEEYMPSAIIDDSHAIACIEKDINGNDVTVNLDFAEKTITAYINGTRYEAFTESPYYNDFKEIIEGFYKEV